MASPSTLVVYVALVANVAITVAKFIVGVSSGSTAVIAEAIHSLIDTGNQALLLVGQRRSRSPASRQHPFGRRRGLDNLLAKVRGSKDPSVFTVLFEDAAALAGVVVAALGHFSATGCATRTMAAPPRSSSVRSCASSRSGWPARAATC